MIVFGHNVTNFNFLDSYKEIIRVNIYGFKFTLVYH